MSKNVPNLSNSVGFFEIVGINLQPNTDYIVTARMSTYYNGHKILSDQSEPVEFTRRKSIYFVLRFIPACVLMLFNNPDQSICAPQPYIHMKWSEWWFHLCVLV